MDKWKQERMAVLYRALRSGNFDAGGKREFEALVTEYATEQSRPIIEAQLAQIAARARTREAARRAGMEAGRAAGRAEYARLMARRERRR